MNAVYRRKGRFVRKLNPESEEEEDAWIIVTDEDVILTKVRQSLRDNKDPETVGLFPALLGSQSLQQQQPKDQPAARPGSSSPLQQQERDEAKRTPLKKRRYGESQFVANPVSASQRPTGDTSMDTASSTMGPFNAALLNAALSGRHHDVGLTSTGLVSSSSAPLSQDDVRMQHLRREQLGNSAVPSLPSAPASLLAALIQKQQQQNLTAEIVGPTAADQHGRLSSYLSQQALTSRPLTSSNYCCWLEKGSNSNNRPRWRPPFLASDKGSH